MKSILLLPLILLIFLIGCFSANQVIETVQLTPGLEMPAHARPLEVFYLQESLQKKTLTELALLRLPYTGNVSEAFLLQHAKTAAQSLGADGIYVLGKEHPVYPVRNLRDRDWESSPEVNTTVFRAVAFVYDENLKDSVHVYKKLLAQEQEKQKTRYLRKRTGKDEIALYRTSDTSPGNMALVVRESVPMKMLEQTDIVLFNKKRNRKSCVYKVLYGEQELYVSGFDVELIVP
ncbi:MAG: hypothetical protein EP344_05525 [Bacteroidetes bacterium]|nr:MAG: hypothetical protein EP344_05525 [Bacteroidota bacterium]